MKFPPTRSIGGAAQGEDQAMNVMHCPLCIGLAVMSVGRAVVHCSLVVLTPWAAVPQRVS